MSCRTAFWPVRLAAFASALVLFAACGNSPEPGPTLVAADIAPADADALVADTLATDTTTPGDTAAAGPCTSNADCAAPTPVCDPMAKQCAQCLFDSDCSGGKHCSAKVCAAATSCKNSLDCATARNANGTALPICDPSSAECVECAGDSDCPEHSTCKGLACKPFTPCSNSKDCGADQVCNPDSGSCVQCLGDNDCGKDQLCEGGACKAFTGCASDKQCTPLGMLCDTKLGKCAQCNQNSDCPGVYHCTPTGVSGTGQCVLDSCAAGLGACIGNAKVLCTQVGDGYGAPEQCPGSTTCVVSEGKPLCKAWACQPGVHCQGDVLVDCSADGFEVVASTNCVLAGQLCLADACLEAVCTPGTLLCQGNTVVQCGADGQSASAVKACGVNQYCEDGVCLAQACTPGKPVCEGNAIKVCNSAGSGPSAGSGTDCGELKCIGGVCKAPSCTPNKTYCVGNQIFVCAGDGYSGALVKECGANAVCQGGSCKAKICEPNQSLCDGNVAKQCNATGTDYTGAGFDCGASKCLAGMCQNQLCPPASTFCDGGKLKTCSADGLSVASEKSCGTGTYCSIGSSGSAECVPAKCTPGALSCSGTTVVTCNSDGSDFAPGGIDCGAKGQICASGACSSLYCDPKNFLYCNGNIVTMCDSTGMKPTPIQTCTNMEYCSNGTCFVMTCSPDAPACNGDQATTCNGGGNGYVGNKVDCKAQGKVCKAGACVTATCGDGKVNQGGEQCDDGNALDGDGCSVGCQLEAKCTAACPAGLVCQSDGSCAMPCSGVDCSLKGGSLLPTPVAGLVATAGGVTVDGVALGAQLPNLWIANSPQNTVSRIDTKTLVEVGRYSVCLDPSRTAVDLDGNAWVACRGDGKVAKIAGSKKNCVDKNGNGAIETSVGNTVVASDECVLFIVQPNKGTYARAVGVDRSNNAWVGYWNSMSLVRLNKDTGGTMDEIALGCSPYGLVLDQQGIIWLQGAGCGGLIRVDPTTKTVTKKDSLPSLAYPGSAYGINVDGTGRLWVASGNTASVYNPKTQQWKVVNMQWGGGRGLATADDGYVYVAVDGSGGAVKINGNSDPPQVIGFIKGAGNPVGAALDYDGYVWVVNQGGSSTTKLDPKTMAAVGTVPVGQSPYTYSDMTGYGLRFVGPYAKTGTWVGTFYAPSALGPYATASQVSWTAIQVDLSLPSGASATVQLKTAPTQSTLGLMSWSAAVPFATPPALDLKAVGAVTGPWLQVQVTMLSNPKGAAPVLQGVSATAVLK